MYIKTKFFVFFCIHLLLHNLQTEVEKAQIEAVSLSSIQVYSYLLDSFPGPARSSLAVRNSHRGPGLVHHVMRAIAYVTTLLLESMMS